MALRPKSSRSEGKVVDYRALSGAKSVKTNPVLVAGPVKGTFDWAREELGLIPEQGLRDGSRSVPSKRSVSFIDPLLEQYRAYPDGSLSARKKIDFIDSSFSVSTSRSNMDNCLTLDASDTEEWAGTVDDSEKVCKTDKSKPKSSKSKVKSKCKSATADSGESICDLNIDDIKALENIKRDLQRKLNDRVSGQVKSDFQGQREVDGPNSSLLREVELLRLQKQKLQEQVLQEKKKALNGEILALQASLNSQASNVSYESLGVQQLPDSGISLADLRAMHGLEERATDELERLGLDWEDSDDDDQVKRGKKGKRSGLSKRSTDIVKSPQIWPHIMLKYEYCGKEISFGDLDFRLFIAGELEILAISSLKQEERSARLRLLQEIVYNFQFYEWSSIRKLYAAILRRIETGEYDWQSDYGKLQGMVLVKLTPNVSNSFVGKEKSMGSKFGDRSFNNPNTTTVNSKSVPNRSKLQEMTWFCRLYQKNKCGKEADHDGKLKNGTEVTFYHICASCFLKDGMKLSHPECSSACPHIDSKR